MSGQGGAGRGGVPGIPQRPARQVHVGNKFATLVVFQYMKTSSLRTIGRLVPFHKTAPRPLPENLPPPPPPPPSYPAAFTWFWLRFDQARQRRSNGVWDISSGKRCIIHTPKFRYLSISVTVGSRDSYM